MITTWSSGAYWQSRAVAHSHRPSDELPIWRFFGLGAALLLLAACATSPYRYDSFHAADLVPQAKTRTEGDISVTAAVPGPEQAHAILGLPVYDRGIQPVWLSIENRGSGWIRFAPTGMDREYFSPLEVAYMHRKGYSKQARAEIERRFDRLGMARFIAPGTTESGFVFTHADTGTKSILVDVYDPDGDDHSFAFFLDVPGFVPDHAQIDFLSLYPEDMIQRVDLTGFRQLLADLPCCSANHEGQFNGVPVAVAMVGNGRDVLRALLRAGWYETAWTREREAVDPAQGHYLFERLPDAVFRIQRRGGTDRNELHVWLAPWVVDGEPVWLAQITHFIGRQYELKNLLFGALFDPDMDDGRNYLLQNFWYTQGLRQYAWLDSGEAVSFEAPRQDFSGATYFTDGYRMVIWLSGKPVSLLESRHLQWDKPPAWRGDQ